MERINKLDEIRKKRVVSLLLDCGFIGAVLIPIGFVFMFFLRSSNELVFCIPYALFFTTVFCKDCFNGRSLAKVITGLQIVNNNNTKTATPFQSIIRNFFIIIWPVELFFCFFNPERRLGDIVAGTKISLCNIPQEKKVC